MKKSIVVKYAWEEDENFKIVITDGTSQREIDSLPQQEGLLQELKDDSCSNQSSASLEGIFGCPIPQEGRGPLQICIATGIPPHVMLLSSM